MSLGSGTRLGAYEILAPIGAGGMGEVYRARDIKLGREVAIKVLPEEFTQHPQKLARFEREARLLAALNHPGIATLYGVEEFETKPFLVMELVEGETLADRIARGPLPVTEALTISRQIAEALEAAHEKGVIHRDLKPANIKVDPEGHVKVLDFGLAKLAEAESESSGEGGSQSPTLSRDATRAGVILGTAAYMSPEQAKGKAVDKRTDIFSFGIVLYEMLTGKRAFSGEDVSDVLASILRSEPDWKVIPSGVDRRVENLLRRCLRKERKNRLQAIGDVRVEIEDILGQPIEESTAATAMTPARRAVGSLLAAIGIAAVAGVGAWNLKPSEPPAEPRSVTRLSITLPEEFAFITPGNPKRSLAVSPDGRQIVYVGQAAEGGRQLYRRSLERLTVEPVPGTEGAAQPFFSPDGNWVGFFTPTELKKVRLDGGSPVTLVQGVPNGNWTFGAWSNDGRIVFDSGRELSEVSAEGGAASPVSVSSPWDDSSLRFPALVDATGDVLFVSGSDYVVNPRIEAIDRETSERLAVVENALLVGVTRSGHLLFVRDEVLMAAAYDAAAHRVGPAVPLPESIARDMGIYPQLAISANGTLAYVLSQGTAIDSTIGWVMRSGEFHPLSALPTGTAQRVHLSSDGRAALISGGFGSEDRTFLLDLSRGLLTRVNVEEKSFSAARWHPEGRRIVLGGESLRLVDLDSGEQTILAENLRGARSPTWTPDGRTVAFMAFAPDENIYALAPDGEEPHEVIATSAREHSPALSPDGRWIAYVSDETGRFEVYVARFPEGDRRTPITANGGFEPLWSRGGQELFFTEGEPVGRRVLRAVSVSLGETLELGEARTLFVTNDPGATENVAFFGNAGTSHDVSADGTRFLMIRRPADPPATEIVVVQNWFEELKRIVPTN